MIFGVKTRKLAAKLTAIVLLALMAVAGVPETGHAQSGGPAGCDMHDGTSDMHESMGHANPGPNVTSNENAETCEHCPQADCSMTVSCTTGFSATMVSQNAPESVESIKDIPAAVSDRVPAFLSSQHLTPPPRFNA
ncbi:MAG: hypothetical protein OEY63_01535 [Gemmatimonadota bacterium]|nr:hypothetical protein [Gemmatimonadota bacterium]MDH5806003.1 hypothetical protein [Gemmatimonadota bacterium]